MEERKCPECGGTLIEWDDGYLCVSCGVEYDRPGRTKNEEENEGDNPE